MHRLKASVPPRPCAAGSGSTLLSKSLYGVRAPRRADGCPKLFRKPLANTLFMFLGMALLLPLLPLVDRLQARLEQRRERQRRRGGASTVPASDASQLGDSVDERCSLDELLLPPAAPPAGQQRRLAAAAWLRQCGLLVVPTLLDVACTAAHKIGRHWGCCHQELRPTPALLPSHACQPSAQTAAPLHALHAVPTRGPGACVRMNP